MNPIRIEPQKALDEAVRFSQKLATGLKTLRIMDEVDYGATAKTSSCCTASAGRARRRRRRRC
jgi:hypothetical protein